MNENTSGQPSVAYLPSAWKPRQCDDLVRLGSKHDGGYIVTENIIRLTDFLVGLGIGTDWTFEEDFHKRKGCPVHCYDHTISLSQFVKYAIRDVKLIIRTPRIINFRRLYMPNILLPLKYKTFFSGNRKHFKEKIGDDPGYHTDFRKIFSRIPGGDKVFIKIDIEGWEYRTLFGLKDYYERLTGLTVEFHHLNTMMDTVDSHINDLSKSFNIVHVHVNNYDGTDERRIPTTIEMTFESKEHSPGRNTPSERTYPVDGLDFPNLAHQTDYNLEFRD